MVAFSIVAKMGIFTSSNAKSEIFTTFSFCAGTPMLMEHLCRVVCSLSIGVRNPMREFFDQLCIGHPVRINGGRSLWQRNRKRNPAHKSDLLEVHFYRGGHGDAKLFENAFGPLLRNRIDALVQGSCLFRNNHTPSSLIM